MRPSASGWVGGNSWGGGRQTLLRSSDDRLQPTGVRAAPVDAPTARAAGELLVRAHGARFQLVRDLLRRHGGGRGTPDPAPGPWRGGRPESIEHLVELVGDVVVHN